MLPVRRFLELRPDDLDDAITCLWPDPRLREAVRVANPVLAAELDKHVAEARGPSARQRRMASALVKYAIRMSTRPTPFGLFAAAGFTEWGDGGLHSEPGELHRNSRWDATVLGQTVRERDGDDELVGRNPTTRVTASRVVVQPAGVTSGPRSVRRSGVVDAVLDFTGTPRRIGDVVELVRGISPNADEGRARTFVETLVGEGFLVNALRPAAPHGFDVGEVVRHSPEPGEPGVLVDVAMEVRGTIDVRHQEKLAEAIAVLQRIALAKRPPAELTRYAHAFAERYGHEEVPVEDVLDSVTGLGALPPRAQDRTEEEHDLDALRRLVLRRALNQDVVTLTREDVAGLPEHGMRPVPSCDVFVQLAGERLVLAPRGVVAPGGRAFSRFAPFDPRVEPLVREAVRHEQEPGTCFAALDYWHDTTVNHAGGVSPYETVLAWSSVTGEALPPADLVVGERDGRLHLRSRVDGRRVVVRTHHLVGTATAPPLPDFVHRVSNEHLAVPAWSWGRFAATAVTLPRIEVGGVVVAPARWRLDTGDTDIALWRKELGVPRFVHVGEGDTRLMLDLDHPSHHGLLVEQRGRGEEWVEESFVDPGAPGHVTELVVTAVNDAYRTEKPSLPTHTDVMPPKPRLPGDGWWAIHLRCDPRAEDQVLRALGSFLPRGRWFFVRYDVPRDHLRVRARAEDIGIDELCAAARLLHDRGLVLGFTVEPYVPEVQRYGGPDGLARCEQLFCRDTEIALRYLDLVRENDPATVAAVLTDAYLTAMGVEGDGPVVRLAREPEHPASRAERQHEHEQRKLLKTLLKADTGWSAEIRAAHANPGHEIADDVAASLVHMHLNRMGVEPSAERRGARRLLAVRSREQQ